MRYLTALAILALLATMAYGQEGPKHYSVEKWVAECKAQKGTEDWGYCNGYALGVLDGYKYAQRGDGFKICSFTGKVTDGIIRGLGLAEWESRSVEERERIKDFGPQTLLAYVMSRVWPCPKEDAPKPQVERRS
jgi:hypothetical protein